MYHIKIVNTTPIYNIYTIFTLQKTRHSIPMKPRVQIGMRMLSNEQTRSISQQVRKMLH